MRRIPRLDHSLFRISSARGFSLLEILVAVAVLSLMLSFMFNLLGTSMTLWETGNRRIEAAQAARVGLNIIARDLENAFAGNMTSYTTNGTMSYNIAPFMTLGNNTTTAMNLGGGALNAAGSQQIAGVHLTNDPSLPPFAEFGFMAVFVDAPEGIEPMFGDRYYLVKKMQNVSSPNSSGGDFYFRDTPPNSTWHNTASEWNPIADNCVRLSFLYYGNQTDSSGPPTWLNNWEKEKDGEPIVDRLPLGVLVSATVIDSRTAERIAAITEGKPLTLEEIDSIFKEPAPQNPTSTERLLRQGAVTVRRFIPFNRN
jgi:prepilin-type N-terminal cleavage/methylation domain-containing protein